MPFEKRAIVTRTGLYLCLVLWLTACSTPRPVLYPNSTYTAVGEEVAVREIDECIALAEDFQANPPSQIEDGTAGDVAAAGAIGAASGAAGGAVVGHAGRGAGVGAAAAGAGTLMRNILRGRRQQPAYTAYHAFVERCLDDRGYEVVGWN